MARSSIPSFFHPRCIEQLQRRRTAPQSINLQAVVIVSIVHVCEGATSVLTITIFSHVTFRRETIIRANCPLRAGRGSFL